MPQSPAFIRPDDWPCGVLAELGMRCPCCGGFDALSVEATVWVDLTEEGSDATGDHHYEQGARAHCRACRWMGTVADCSELPSVRLPLSSLTVEWSTVDGSKSARWEAAQLLTTSMDAYAAAISFWPGVTVTTTEQDVRVTTDRTDVGESLTAVLEDGLGAAQASVS